MNSDETRHAASYRSRRRWRLRLLPWADFSDARTKWWYPALGIGVGVLAIVLFVVLWESLTQLRWGDGTGS